LNIKKNSRQSLPAQLYGVARRRANMNMYRSDQNDSGDCHYLPVAGVLLDGDAVQEADNRGIKDPVRNDAWMNEWLHGVKNFDERQGKAALHRPA
jgi:hypothetical protein